MSPLTLAASIRVDSCFMPSIIPMIQISVSATLLQMRLANHLQNLSTGKVKVTLKVMSLDYGHR